jgi:hypothetical protein
MFRKYSLKNLVMCDLAHCKQNFTQFGGQGRMQRRRPMVRKASRRHLYRPINAAHRFACLNFGLALGTGTILLS